LAVSVAIAVDATPDRRPLTVELAGALGVVVGPGVAVAVGSSGICGAAERAIDEVSGSSELRLFHQAKLGQAPPLRQPGIQARKMAIDREQTRIDRIGLPPL